MRIQGSADTIPAQCLDTPRVSVICSFFQAKRYFRETIDSVLKQDFEDFELLLVDDGSSDGSTEIALEYQGRDPRVRYLDHPDHANRGTCTSRNLGLRHARGDYIAFIDADDCWRPTKLNDQVQLLDDMAEVDAVCGAVNFWASRAGGEDEVVPTGHVLNTPVSPPEALLKVYPLGRADPPCPSDLLMRRATLDAIGGFEESFTGPLQLYEDQAFLAKLYLQGTIYFSDRVWLNYRLHDQSCTFRVQREGLGPQVRGHCLEWFESYLATTRYRHNPRIRLMLMRALAPYRHPKLWTVGRKVKSLFRRLRPSRITAPA